LEGASGAGTWAGRDFTVALASNILILSAMGVRPTTLESRDILLLLLLLLNWFFTTSERKHC
jgi:hypothetical protein